MINVCYFLFVIKDPTKPTRRIDLIIGVSELADCSVNFVVHP